MNAPIATTHWLRLELLTEVVFSRRNASVGLHECLDYVPGSALLGAAAAHLFGQTGFGAEFFLSGHVRFGDGLPDNGCGGPAWPAPLSFHVGKGLSSETDKLINLLTEEIPKDSQLAQVRDRHLMADGRRQAPRKRYQLKTSMERNEFGRAKENTLHGYDALPAGSVFFAPVTFASGVADKARESLLATLTGGSIRLGRSRSAQYGGVRITRAGASCAWPSPGAGLPQWVALYLASDLALCLANGASTLTPAPEYFGLPSDAHYLPEKSFVRTRRYSPWNAFRQAHDAERQVLLRGSVLAFAAPSGLNRAELAAQLAAHGAGLHTQEGLGRAFVDPDFVLRAPPAAAASAQNPEAADREAASHTSPLPVVLQADPLALCLWNRAEARRIDTKARELAAAWTKQCQGYPKEHFPSRSQWNDVRNLTMVQGDWLEKLREYFNPKTKRAEVWNLAPRDSHLLALGTALLEECGFLADPELARAAMRETAVSVVRWLQVKGRS
jgi:CRISPR-associated protein Csx10